MDLKKRQLTEPDAARGFFRLVKAFSTPEKPQKFDARCLCPGENDKEVAEKLAAFFNRISAEFDPLTPGQIPLARTRKIDLLVLMKSRPGFADLGNLNPWSVVTSFRSW